MTIRFFILQAHYRSTLDFSNSALQAAQKGLERVLAAAKDTNNLPAEDVSKMSESAASQVAASGVDGQIFKLKEDIWDALLDDMNTPIALSYIFDAVKIVNSVKASAAKITTNGKAALQHIFKDVLVDVLGIVKDGAAQSSGEQGGGDDKLVASLMDMILKQRAAAKAAKDWATSDAIRDALKEIGVQIKDGKEGTEWSI